MPTNSVFDSGVRTIKSEGFVGHCYVCELTSYMFADFDSAKQWFRKHFKSSHRDYTWIEVQQRTT